MTRYAVARGPGPFFLRAPPPSLNPARPPPPPFPLVAAVAAAAAMSLARSPLSLREHHRLDLAGQGGGGRRGRGEGGAETPPTGPPFWVRAETLLALPPLSAPQSLPPSWVRVIPSSGASPRPSLAPFWVRSIWVLANVTWPALLLAGCSVSGHLVSYNHCFPYWLKMLSFSMFVFTQSVYLPPV